MSMKISLIGGFNPFDWEALHCPVCNGNRFYSINYASVYCSECGAQFAVRSTTGDPGCVIDCYVDPIKTSSQICAPLWKCEECNTKVALFEWQELICPQKPPEDASHTLRRVEGLLAPWKRPEEFPGYFYLILKHRDYCSSWLRGDNCEHLDHPSQDEWDEFQKGLKLDYA